VTWADCQPFDQELEFAQRVDKVGFHCKVFEKYLGSMSTKSSKSVSFIQEDFRRIHPLQLHLIRPQ
jgi:hypothetical protein